MNANAAVLVVDDEEDIRRFLATILNRAGYRVDQAADSRQALDLLQAAPYELLITDLAMPGMNGLELLRQVAERHPQTKGIVLTGYGSIQSAVEATKLGADNYITKPIVIEEFVQQVHATLETGRPLRTAPTHAVQVATLAGLTRLLSRPQLDLRQLADGSVEVIASTLAGSALLRIVDEAGNPLIEARRGVLPDSLPEPALLLPDSPHRLTAGLSAPKGTYRGALAVCRSHAAAPFTREETDLLQVAATQISIAVGNLLAGRSLAMTLLELRDVSLQTVQALVRAVELRDHYTAGHSARVAHYSVALARSLGMDAAQVEQLRVAALLHDVGKIGISDLLLNKPGPLTPDERARIEEHPAIGCQIVEGVQTLAQCVPLIMHHQERYDGLGYPGHLAGEQIPFGARILAIADSFEAITATRAYRKGRSAADALAILETGTGKQWDPDLVALWRQNVARILAQCPPSSSEARMLPPSVDDA